MTYTLRLAMDADMLLNANQRLHWRPKADRTRHWRELAWVHARNALLAGQLTALPNAHIVVEMAWPDRRRRDVANFHPTAKALVDGLVDAGVLQDDNDKHVTGPDLRRTHGPASITLRITPWAEQVAS